MSQREWGEGEVSHVDRQEVRKKNRSWADEGWELTESCADRRSPRERLWTMQKKDGCWDIEGLVRMLSPSPGSQRSLQPALVGQVGSQQIKKQADAISGAGKALFQLLK